MHLQLPRGLAANIQISTCIAFLIVLISGVNAITPSSANDNVNAIQPDVVNDKTQVFDSPAIPLHSSYASKALMAGESVISAPSNFNKIALQQQQQRHQHQTSGSVRQDLSSLDNKRDGHAAAAAATGKNNASHENNNASASDDTIRNGFHDKINISNQRNEFNGQPESTPGLGSASSSSSSSSPSSSSSSFFERVELQESLWPPNEHPQLLLHRQKRYLLFPEGSSFQMVFDLIIGVVDYTSFAILGITCAVAWELPSKPPSEIIENFRDKLNDGTFALARRNDTAGDDIKYIDRNDGGAGNYGNQAQVSATVAAAATSDRVNYENGDRKPMATSAPAAPATSPSYYYNNPSVKHLNPYAPTAAAPEPAPPHTPPYDAYYSQRPTSAHNNFNSAANNNNNNFALYDKSQRKTLYRNGGSDANSDDYTTFNTQTKPYSKYYKNVNGVSSTSGYVSADKQTFTDWHRPSTSQAHQSDKYGGKGNKYYHNDYQQQQYTQGHGSWDDNNKPNWWQRNKQRVESNWREKQHIWAKYETEAAQDVQPNAGAASWRDKPAVWAKYENDTPQQMPVTTYAGPPPSAPATRTGRNRKILRAPPKHRIYPVFGKRRRRLSRSKDMDTFERKLQQIHLREHLQTRQKLYGKIEQLYKVRGHNGTACVLRALCETGQSRRHHHHHQHTKPQSFITELLRAIFVLPEDEMDNEMDMNSEEDKLQSSEINVHMAARYREAHAAEAENSCAQRFPMCEHSIWQDV